MAQAVGMARRSGAEKERMFFFEKRTKKLLPFGARCRLGPRQPVKSLLRLFFRKEDLAFLLPSRGALQASRVGGIHTQSHTIPQRPRSGAGQRVQLPPRLRRGVAGPQAQDKPGGRQALL